MTEKKIQAIRGMNDVLPTDAITWRSLENLFTSILKSYGYQEIRFPILESTHLFKRTLGEITDIVEKEMYTFHDLNGDSLTLRPEGTASCVRACIEHGLLYNQHQKLWYIGPMFRHERPQKGRYRQFNQLGVEVFGIPGLAAELELLNLCHHFWKRLGLEHEVSLQINSLGELSDRLLYKERLLTYFNMHVASLDDDSKKRLTRNPLRILDSKNPDMKELIANAPKLIDSLSAESHHKFEQLCDGLRKTGINYTINPTLVRGLDYYSHTVFEWVTTHLGSQATICAGGRYDGLVGQLGGNPTPAVGFAIGLERIILLLEQLELIKSLNNSSTEISIFLIGVNDEAIVKALCVAESLREEYPNFKIYVNTAGGSFKSQFKRADKSGARLALVLGEEELGTNTITIKDLRQENAQVAIDLNNLNQFLKDYLGEQ